MRVITMILLLYISAMASGTRWIRGRWEDSLRTYEITKDSFIEIAKQTGKAVRVDYGLEVAEHELHLILFIYNRRPGHKTKYKGIEYVTPDTTLRLGVPTAILRREKKNMLMKMMNLDGIMIQDYNIFPWPDFEKPYRVLWRPSEE